MPDPVTFSALGGVAATEGIKFLYGQAAELLKAWRDRRHQVEAGGALPAQLTVPIVDNEVLDAAPTGAAADVSVLDRESKSLVQLVGALSPYADGMADTDPDDEELGEQAGRLRALLEAVYGQRFTFRGEQRDPTGTRVTVRQVLGEVEGSVVGADAGVGPGGDLGIDQDVNTVRTGGSVIGFKGRIGP
jgi:hypothetical protein